MVAYSFNRRFIEPIRAGTKRQTIRAPRKRSRHVQPGDKMHLYTAMRTKHCQLIGIARCSFVNYLTLDFNMDNVEFRWCPGQDYHPNFPETQLLCQSATLNRFAQSDGFDSWDELREFWAQAHPNVSKFFGLVIVWEGLQMEQTP